MICICYITHFIMLCYIIHDMLCYGTHDYVMLYNT